ncbi:hypothetical protein ACJX0J_013415, partial [Zea mays]
CMVGDIGDKFFTKRALRGVHAVICLTDNGFFSELIDFKGVGLQCSYNFLYRNSGGLHAIMNSKLKKLAKKDEEVVVASGIPCTTIRTGSLQSAPGGERGFNFTEGRKRKEDAAAICVEALNSIPQKTLIFERDCEWTFWAALLWNSKMFYAISRVPYSFFVCGVSML